MPIDTDLRRLRVAVTGGTSGLGLALVRLLTAMGARVAFVAVLRDLREIHGAHEIRDVGRRRIVRRICPDPDA